MARDDIRELRKELRDLRRRVQMRPIVTSGSSGGATPSYPWVQLLAKGGQTLVTTAPKVYGLKRKVGEAKQGGWLYLPRRATATCTLGTGGAAGTVISTTVFGVGALYAPSPAAAPVVTVSAPPSGGTQAVMAALVGPTSNNVEGVYITDCGTLYGTVSGAAPVVTFSDPPTGYPAIGKAWLRDGKVVAITLTGTGAGYVTAPTVTIAASDGGGTLATAVAVLGVGSISISVSNPGAGYVTAPTVTIAPPPQMPYPAPPQIADDTPAAWADGIGWGIIQGGSLTGSVETDILGLICHDDRSLVPYGLMGEGGASPAGRQNDSVLSWYRTLVKLSIADADADGVLPAWVPMAGGA